MASNPPGPIRTGINSGRTRSNEQSDMLGSSPAAFLRRSAHRTTSRRVQPFAYPTATGSWA